MKLTLLSRRTGMWALAGAALIAGAAACSESAPPAPPPPPAPVVKSAEARVQWYQDCWGLFNDKAWDKFQACYSDDVISETVDSAQPAVNGAANVIARGKAEATSFPDRRGEVRVVLGNGEKLASVALYTGTNTGPLPPGPDGKPGPVTGKPIGFLLAHTVDLDPPTGSKAIREAAYIEEGTMMAQLGLNPTPARKAEKPSGATTMVVIAKNDATEKANLAAAQAMFDAFNLHDAKAMEAMTPADYKAIEIARPKDLGKKESMAGLKEMFNAFPDVRLTIATMWAAGDFVVITGTFDGTNTGDMPSMGMKKTGKKVSSRFFELVRFEAGKPKDDWLFYNSAAWAAQLGAK